MEDLDSLRVLDKRTTLEITNLSEDTWDRLERRGQTPPITRLSARRIGYRLADIRAWLDGRREGTAA
jgi:predicted DNA-binding transcriptional regulator AlpA